MNTKVELASAYVDPDEVVLKPENLDKSVLERMPQPTGWRILVLPYRGRGMTKGGIALTQETLDKEQLATNRLDGSPNVLIDDKPTNIKDGS